MPDISQMLRGVYATARGLLPQRLAAPEMKKSAANGLIALHAQGQPVWTPHDFATLTKQGFKRNPVGYRCVRMIAEAAASVPWLLY